MHEPQHNKTTIIGSSSLTDSQKSAISRLEEAIKEVESKTGITFKNCKVHTDPSPNLKQTMAVSRDGTLSADIQFLEENEPFLLFVVAHEAMHLQETTAELKNLLLNYTEILPEIQSVFETLCKICNDMPSHNSKTEYNDAEYAKLTDRLIALGIYNRWNDINEKAGQLNSILKKSALNNLDEGMLADYISNNPNMMLSLTEEVKAVVGSADKWLLASDFNKDTILQALSNQQEATANPEALPFNELLFRLIGNMGAIGNFTNKLSQASEHIADDGAAKIAGAEMARAFFSKREEENPLPKEYIEIGEMLGGGPLNPSPTHPLHMNRWARVVKRSTGDDSLTI